MPERDALLDVLRAFDKAAAELEDVASYYAESRARRIAADWHRDLTKRARQLAEEWNDCGHPDIKPIEDAEWRTAYSDW